jgi:tetraacyldisaccharide 4'-kinase
VGNIYVGGTGKTPLASEIFKITKSLGKNPAFVKKYYDYLKDEITMLKKVGTTFVSKSRKEAIESLIKNKNDIAILDDGFQDYTIKKNFSVVCFNQKQWIGNGLVIPSGPLRERITAVNRSDCIVINGERNIKIEDQIYNKNKNVKIFYSKYKPVDINRFKDKQIYAFSGIGNPSNFFDLLKENNLNLIGTNSFPDHCHFTVSDLEMLIKKINSEKNQILLTTEKDYFRIHDNFKTHFQYLKIELEIENKDNFIELIKKNI